MTIQKQIEALSLQQVLYVAIVVALLIVIWQNKELIQAKLDQ